ncbi:glycosyltransferase family 87 protein, partial [Falsiroseomonas oryziterrae]|uniref:glycosyltransferase family 87 protein n=1 Tax=Falsiroseomonas oryziterrae TaxID=2911368 RepID=UPI001F44322D
MPDPDRSAAPGGRLSPLRDAPWLNATRLRAYAWMLLAAQAAVAASVLFGEGLLDLAGNPVGTDFSSFWTASRLALDGAPLLAWDPAAHHAAQRALFGADVPYFAFFYPPPFLLACLPLALLPYGWSLAAWLLATLAAWLGALRALLPQRWAVLAMLAFPAAWVNVTHGQNGFLTAALFAAAALALDRRAWVAGLCIGALVIKPHLAVAIPLALLVTRRWAAVLAAALASLTFLGLSWLVFGEAGWRAFLAVSALARETLEAGLVEPGKMVSVFAAARLLGAGLTVAWVVQGLTALAAAALVGAALRRSASGVATLAVAAAATPLM